MSLPRAKVDEGSFFDFNLLQMMGVPHHHNVHM